MKSATNPGERPGSLEAFLERGNFWEKKSPDGCHSLMKALSNAIFFTEIYHFFLQKQVLLHFLRHVRRFAEGQALCNDKIRAFLENPSLPEFEPLNLEIAACFLRTRIKLYHSSGLGVCAEMYFQKTQTSIRLLRSYDNHYSALFKMDFKEKAALTQDVVLGIVDAVLNDQVSKYADRPAGEPINFEFENFLVQTAGGQAGSDCGTFLGNSGENNTDDASFDFKKLSISNNFFEDNLGEFIVSNLHQRKSAAFPPQLSVIEWHYDLPFDFLNGKVNERLIQQVRLSFGSLEPDINFLFNNLKKKSSHLFGGNQRLFDIELLSNPRSVSELGPSEGHGISQRSCPTNFFNFLSQCRARLPPQDRAQYTCNSNATCPESNEQGQEVAKPSDTLTAANTNHSTFSLNRETESPNNECPNSVSPMTKQKLTLKERMRVKKESKNISVFESIESSQSKDLPTQPVFSRSVSETNASWPFLPFENYMEDYPANFWMQPMGFRRATPLHEKQNRGVLMEGLFKGKLKFFDEKNNFGFITTDIKGVAEDIFLYGSEFDEAGIGLDIIRTAKYGNELAFEFNIAQYFGKYKKSKKAVNLQLVL